MNNQKEKNCGTIGSHKILDIHEVMEEAAQAGHLLSCGGIYLSKNTKSKTLVSRYDFLHLPSKHEPLMVLKNFKPYTSSPELPQEAPEKLSQNKNDPLKKLLREQLN